MRSDMPLSPINKESHPEDDLGITCNAYKTEGIDENSIKMDDKRLSPEYERRLFHVLSEYVDAGIWMGAFAEDAAIEFVNAYALEMLGYTREQYEAEQGDKLFGFVLEEDISFLEKNMQLLKSGKETVTFKIHARKRNGIIPWLMVKGVAFEGEPGEQKVLLVLRSMTDKNLAESTVNRLEQIVGNMAGGLEVCKWNEVFTILFVNKGLENLTGYSSEELIGLREHMALVLPEDRDRLYYSVAKQLRKGNHFSTEYRIRRKCGEILWVVDKGLLVETEGEEPNIQRFLTDITEQKEKAELLKQKSFELEAITNNIQAAIIRCIYNRALTIIYANDGFFRMIGYTKTEFKRECHNAFCDLVHQSDLNIVTENLSNQLKIGNMAECTCRLVRKNGEILWVLIGGSLIQRSASKLELHGVITDITIQKKREEALMLSEERYKLAMKISEVTMFDYNIATKQMAFHRHDREKFELPEVIENAVEGMIERGIVHSASARDFRELYRKIEAGAPTAMATIYVNDPELGERIYEIDLNTIFDASGKPIHAVGARKDITETILLQKEKEYGSIMPSNQQLIYEANVTKNKILSYNLEWAKEFGISDISSFSALNKSICHSEIAFEYRDILERTLCKEHILEVYDQGQRLITIEYHKENKSGGYHWYNQSINIVRDKRTGEVSIRCYLSDINELKLKEIRAMREQQLYNSMLSRAETVCELNLTKNTFVTGHEDWCAFLKIANTNNFSCIMDALRQKAVHPDDKNTFEAQFSRDNAITTYKKGETELSNEYRKLNDEGNFVWVRCTMHLFEDPENGDIRAHAFMEDINEEKQREFELIYKAEHDLLTGFYDKAATEKHITDYFATCDGKNGKHALFMVDTDYFKAINDNFGHAFGDAVLSQVTAKMRSLFREVDILGRVGGDEFVVLMKNIQSNKTAIAKAREVCDNVLENFTQNDVCHNISASIGITFYPEHGTTYDTLYRHADAALYISKDNGRNQYTVYSDDMMNMISATNEINSRKYEEVRTFGENSTEYVFRILYETLDKAAAINLVLGLIGKHFDLGRAYIYENFCDKTSIVNTFEWCNSHVSPQINTIGGTMYEGPDFYLTHFNENGIYFVPDVSKLESSAKIRLDAQGAKTTIRFIFARNGEIKGFVGFDECSFVRIPTKKEISDLKVIANILGLFVMEMRTADEISSSRTRSLSIINGLDSYAFVCDPATYKILFLNDKSKELNPNMSVGDFCYMAFWQCPQPCENCAMRNMLAKGLAKDSIEMYSPIYDMWVKSTAAKIEWKDGKKMCLIDNVDITACRKKA